MAVRRATGGSVVGLALLACAAAPAPPVNSGAPQLAPGNYQFVLRHSGRDRTYRVHVPRAALGGQPLPAVILFHGGGGNAAAAERELHLDDTADREGFLALYPNGTGRWRNRLLTFNAGSCCGYASDHHVDDVGFTLAVLDDIARRTPLDRHRVYATGLSNGAMMAYRLAAQAADRIAAIAPVAGGLVLDSLAPSHPVAIMDFHSVDDPRALYHGGLGPPFPLTSRNVMHPDMDQVLSSWRRADGCPDLPSVAPTLAGPPESPDSGQTATRYVWAPCAGGSEIVHWKLTGVGHTWPGSDRGWLEARFVGRPTHLIDANEEMWRFFTRFSR